MPERPTAPVFETLDGCPRHPRMVVDGRKPAVRLSTDEPVDGYSWNLLQDGAVVESEIGATEGITGGTCIRFTPTAALRRGRPEDAKVPVGFFYPPFGPRRAYRTSTYAGHSDFSVDLNRGSVGDDEGDWVRAPAPGTVAFLEFRAPGTNGPQDEGESDLLIDHAGGYRTLYSHMSAIPRDIRVGAPVTLRQRLGSISDVGDATGTHLHHAHFRKDAGAAGFGRPIKMRIMGIPMDASVRDSSTLPPDSPVVSGQVVVGPVLKPTLRVRARRASDGRWSPWRDARFLVSESGDEVPDCVDPGCEPLLEE